MFMARILTVLHQVLNTQARDKNLLVWTKEKSAPDKTALAFLRDSTSPARASLRTSKFWRSQSQSLCKLPRKLTVAKDSFILSVRDPVSFSNKASASALAPSFSVMLLESITRFSAASLVNVSYSDWASFSSTSISCISLSKSATSMSIMDMTPPLSSLFLEYASQVAGGGGGASFLS